VVTSRRRLLVVSFHFPPAGGVASARVGKLVRYLPEHGWDVDVVAGPPAPTTDASLAEGMTLGEVVRVAPRRGLPALQGAAWAAAAAGPARRLARRADAVLISGGPFAPFALARLLRRPVVLDLRDPWSWEPRFGRLDRRLRRRVGLAAERAVERRALRAAAAVVTVTPELAAGYPGTPIETIRHGWDPRDFAGPPADPADPPELVYAGSFLAGERTPELAVETTRLVRASGRPLRLRLVGSLPAELRALTAVGEREGWISVDGLVSSRESVDAMRRASVLWAQPGDLPFLITGKIYEYLATRRPVVAAAPADGALARFVAEVGGAVVVPVDARACAEAVAGALAGTVPPVAEAALAELAAPQLAARLAAILDRVAG